MSKDDYRTETNKDVYAESNGRRGLEEHSIGTYSDDYVKWLEAKLKEYKQQTEKWISVEDRKPPHCQNVAVLVKNIDFNGKLCEHFSEYTAYISYRDRWLLNTTDFNKRGHTVDGYIIYFWMPLPKPPKKEERINCRNCNSTKIKQVDSTSLVCKSCGCVMPKYR